MTLNRKVSGTQKIFLLVPMLLLLMALAFDVMPASAQSDGEEDCVRKTCTPTDSPPEVPTEPPTETPTKTCEPTFTPTDSPPEVPTEPPTETPTKTCEPTVTPTFTLPCPTNTPSYTATDSPPMVPTDPPTDTPTDTPTGTDTPTSTPTCPVWDFGDCPDPTYATLLANNGARHAIRPGLHLGNLIDAEPDGFPSAFSDGDDLNGLDDEDGVYFASMFAAGQYALIVVQASGNGYLNAWIDANADAYWDGAGEHVIVDEMLIPGMNFLIISIPLDAVEGMTCARFRYSSQKGLSYYGPADDGEVEDYPVCIVEVPCSPTCSPTDTPTKTPTNTPTWTPTSTPSDTPTNTPTWTPTKTPTDEPPQVPTDPPTNTPTPTNTPCPYDFGDAPDQYRTLLLSQGAQHAIDSTLYLGDTVDPEDDGQPSFLANGDDLDMLDDEDGIIFTSFIVQGSLAMVTVQVNGAGFFSGWLDFNIDGDWDDIGEKVFNDQPLSPGLSNLFFFVPPSAVPGFTYARFRFSREMGLDSYGCSTSGEVEDYIVQILWNDCPPTCPPTETCPCETNTPTMTPTNTPTDSPPEVPTDPPTNTPTCPVPTDTPTTCPPTFTPTDSPPQVPTDPPTDTPTDIPPSPTPTCTPPECIWNCFGWDFNTFCNTEGWFVNKRCTNFGSVEGSLNAEISGMFSTMYSPNYLGLDADEWYCVKFRLHISDGDYFRLGYKKRDGSFLSIPINLVNNDDFITYRFCFKGKPGYENIIDQFKIVPYAPIGTQIHLDYFYICKCDVPMKKMWEFQNDGDFEGWYNQRHLTSCSVIDNCMYGVTTGYDPIFRSPINLNLNAGECSKIEVRMRVTAGNFIDLFFADYGQPFTGTNRKRKMITPSTDFVTYTFDMSTVPTWVGNIDKLRLDPTSTSGTEVQIDYISVY